MVPKILNRKHRHGIIHNVEHERLLSLVNSMADGVIATDQHLKVVVTNGAALNVLDTNDSLKGRLLQNVFKPYDKNNQPVDIEQLVTSLKVPTTSRDYYLKFNDGSIVKLYISIAPVHLGYGEKGRRGFVVLLRDITREKSLEEERDEFISVVSHELRTPLAITEGNISNAQYVAESTKDIDTIKQALKDAHNQVLYLSHLVNDLATLSRAERGKLTVDITAIDSNDLLSQLKSAYEKQAVDKGLKLIVHSETTQKPLYSSELYVREILQNFITNALKYTQKGSVTISAESKAKGTEFKVSDTGIGISKSDREKLFDKFFRSEDYRTRQTSGTGLGLYVTLKLARLIHADIDVHSRLNEGSVFTVFIPNLQ